MTSVRIRAKRGRHLARETARAMLIEPGVDRFLLVTCTQDGTWNVLAGGQMGSWQAGQAALIAGHAAVQLEQAERQQGLKPDLKFDLDTPTYPELVAHKRSGRIRQREITADEQGELQAPKGEEFMFCGECSANRWFVTVNSSDGGPGRIACVRCGNEIAMLRVTAQPGTA